MTVQEAYKIIKKEYPEKVVVECLEFADFYAFALAEKGTEGQPRGGAYDTVDKVSGELDGFNPITDFDAFFSAKKIPIDTLN